MPTAHLAAEPKASQAVHLQCIAQKLFQVVNDAHVSAELAAMLRSSAHARRGWQASASAGRKVVQSVWHAACGWAAAAGGEQSGEACYAVFSVWQPVPQVRVS